MITGRRGSVMGSMMALGALAALAGSSAGYEPRFRDIKPESEHRLRPYAGKPFRGKGSRWAKKAHRRGGNPAKRGPVA